MLTRTGYALRAWASRVEPRTNVYGLARSLLAASTLITLAATPAVALFGLGAGRSQQACATAVLPVFFCFFPVSQLNIARWLAAAALLIVMIGWRPRLTGIMHWWLTYSFMAATAVVDGGDQINAILTLLIVPVALSDGRSWHWQEAPVLSEKERWSARHFALILPALLALVAVRLQVAGIYFQAADAKTRIEEWRDGTAIYYWLTDPTVGLSPWLSTIVRPLLLNGVIVTALTWGPLALEFFLFAGLLMDRRYRPWLLLLGVLFHLGIAIAQGLVAFGIVMWAALLLYLWPVNRALPIRLKHFPKRTESG